MNTDAGGYIAVTGDTGDSIQLMAIGEGKGYAGCGCGMRKRGSVPGVALAATGPFWRTRNKNAWGGKCAETGAVSGAEPCPDQLSSLGLAMPPSGRAYGKSHPAYGLQHAVVL
jgi:hypothetical protein